MLIPNPNIKDNRIILLARHIEFIQDQKYHIKPLEMAELILEFLDNMYGQAYAQKIAEASADKRSFDPITDKV